MRIDDLPVDPDLLTEHRAWLKAFDPRFLKVWEAQLENNPESASCEAAVRRLIQQNGNAVSPNLDLKGTRRSPDFRFTNPGATFLVEVTCLSIEKATELTGLSHLPPPGFTFSGVGKLLPSIFHAAISKTPQCADQDSPVLLAIGTFHWQASHICFERKHLELLLSGDTCLAQSLDTSTGTPVGDTYVGMDLKTATFLKPSPSAWVAHARSPISAILACGLGLNDPVARGGLHPKPDHPFDRNVLPKVEFCRLKPGFENGHLLTEWFRLTLKQRVASATMRARRRPGR